MLRTNSKKAIFNIREYIYKNFNGEGYDDAPESGSSDFKTVAKFIYNVFQNETKYSRTINLQDKFEQWSQGLPCVLDTCYHYNRSAVADLAEILEETAEEAAKYTEQKAEVMLDRLIYRELVKETL